MKIKDLADVILDSALSSFPVDSERYELTTAVELLAAYRMRYLDLYEHENWRINDWLTEANLKVRIAAECLNAQYGSFDQLTAEEKELSDQLMRLIPLPDSVIMANTSETDDAFEDWLHAVAWLQIAHRMSRSRVFREEPLQKRDNHLGYFF